MGGGVLSLCLTLARGPHFFTNGAKKRSQMLSLTIFAAVPELAMVLITVFVLFQEAQV